jgi:beta-glucosidase
VRFVLDSRDLSEVDDSGARAVSAGSYTIFLGGGQPGEAPGVQTHFVIQGSKPLPR